MYIDAIYDIFFLTLYYYDFVQNGATSYFLTYIADTKNIKIFKYVHNNVICLHNDGSHLHKRKFSKTTREYKYKLIA